ncbi:MAG: hypothetical protein U0556_05260 [Dehalococcoidia bacterium]
MDNDVLTQVLTRLAPRIVTALAGRAERLLVWIAVEPGDDRCAIHFLTPATARSAEETGALPAGESGRLKACVPALSLPVVVTGPSGWRQSWLSLTHRPNAAALSPN